MTTTRRAGAGIVVAAAIVVTAANLRPAVVAVPPVVPDIRADLGLDAAAAGLISTASVVCFGLLAFAGPALARRLGLEAAVVTGLSVLAAGIALRLLPGALWLYLGAVLVGAGIAVGNTLLPGLVKRDFPHRVGLLTGLYSGGLNVGAGIAAAIAVPVADASGSWRVALGVWLLPALIAIACWLALRRRWTGPVRPAVAGDAPSVPLRRSRLAWAVSGFFAAQSLLFYAATAWLPTLFTDAGVAQAEAGVLLGYANVVGLVAAVTVPALAGRVRDQVPPLLGIAAIYVVALAGLALAPATTPWLPWVWSTLFGVAQGGGLALGLLLITVRAGDVRTATRLSGMAQTTAYLVAAAGPVGLGALHEAIGGWQWPVAVLGLVLVPFAVAGLYAGRDRVVGGA